MQHEWTRMRPFTEGRELKARIVCARCPAEKRMHFNTTAGAWEEVPGVGKGLTEACPIKV